MPSFTWTPARHATRKRQNVKLRQTLGEHHGDRPATCWVADCGNASGWASEGATGRFCKTHAESYRRHGCPWRGSYAAPETNPARRAVLAWLKLPANAESYFVPITLERVEGLYRDAGPQIEPRNLRGGTSREKATALWARLRDAGVDPAHVIAAVVGVQLVFEADPQAPSAAWGAEFRRVQVAKVLMRMAGGEIRRWARKANIVDAFTGRTETPPAAMLRKFPSSSGKVLRIVGKQAEEACEFVTSQHMRELQAFAASRPATKASLKTPYPKPAKPKPRIPAEAKPTGSFATREAAKAARRKERERERKAAALATTATPEQEAARQPTVKALKGGRWVDDAKADAP